MKRLTLLFVLLAWGFFPPPCQAWLRVPTPPDVDKPDTDGDGEWPDAGDNSCWLASAANMLSAAGYGNAQTIYGALVDQFVTDQGGSADEPLDWYTGEHPGNPYTKVTAYTDPKYCTPDFIASELRRGQFVSIGLSYQPGEGAGMGHTVTVWGDPGTATEPNLSQCWITDSNQDQSSSGLDIFSWAQKTDAPYNGRYYLVGYPEDGGDPYYVDSVITLCPVPEPGTGALALLAGAFFLVRHLLFRFGNHPSSLVRSRTPLRSIVSNNLTPPPPLPL